MQPPNNLSADRELSLIYTYENATSTQLKCTVITNENLTEQQRVIFSAQKICGIELNEDDIHLSWHTISRSYESIFMFVFLSVGASVAFSHPDSRFFTDAASVKPTVIYSVPSNFLRIYSIHKIALSSWGLIYQFFFFCVFI